MVTIIPAILATTQEEFSQQLEKIKSSSDLVDGWVHIDFMDGKLVETTSIPVSVVKNFDIPFQKEAHLMVENPYDYIKELHDAGFARVIIHLEAQAVVDTLQLIKQFGMDAGIAINPETSLEKISDIGQEVSVIMVMGIHPGKQGQPFLTSTYDRVKEVRNICETVAVDGSVNDMTAARLVAAGASRLVIGSYLQKGDIDENLEKIWEIIG
jgi:ribulose-phosphate 3-epimerase